MQKFRILWSFTEGEKPQYLFAIVAIAVATLCSYLTPLIIRVTIDSIIGGKPVDAPQFVIQGIERLGGIVMLQQHLWLAALLVVGATVLQGIALFLNGRWVAQASEQIARNLRDRLYNHLQRLPFAYHSNAETGDLIQRCTSDVETIRRFLAMQLIELGRAGIMIATVLPIMFYLDVRMTLVSMAVIPVIFGYSVVFFLKVQHIFEQVDEAEADLSTMLQENLTGIRVVRAFARHDYEREKFDQKNRLFRDNQYRLIRLMAMYWSNSELFCHGQVAGVLLFGSLWAVQGRLTLGTLVVFLTYIKYLMWPVRQMGRVLTDMGKSLVSVGRIQEILDERPEEQYARLGQGEEERLRGEITFRNVHFAYSPDVPVLQNVSFQVKPGQTVAIMGATGSGKSTLVKLLPRLYDYADGSITIDGRELKTFDQHWLRRQIGIVLQEPFLFSKTLRENICLGNGHADDQKIFEITKIAAIHDTILEFEQGYDTPVGERGVTLSGGQKQRVAIARALLQNPPILIFDDSLSAVDTETEARIQKALAGRRGRATTFVITHRVTSAMNADHILVLDQGQIVQAGTHQELMEQDGLYQRTWQIQHALSQALQAELTLKHGHIEPEMLPEFLAEDEFEMTS